MELPPTTLLISSRNRPELLFDTVRSILAGDEVPNEMIVVDQSDLRHPALACFGADHVESFRYLWSPSSGASRGRNTAIRAARHDLLVLTDDDMMAPPGWFGTLVRALVAAGPRSVVTGGVLPLRSSDLQGHAPSTCEADAPAVYEGRIDADVLYTGNMAMHRSAVDEIGMFDERLGPGTRFPAAEDNDFGYRLLGAGYQIVYDPEAVLFHRAWRRGLEYLRLQWDYGVGRGAYYAKHTAVRDPFMLSRMVKDVGRTLAYSVRKLPREPYFAFGGAATALGVLSGAAAWTVTAHVE